MGRNPRTACAWRNSIGTAAAVASLSIGAGVAFAGSGGGTSPPEGPRVSDVRCLETCAGMRKATTGSKVELTGRHLARTAAVKFDAVGGDQLEVAPTKAERRSVKAMVPEGAETGAPKVVSATDQASSSPTELTIVDPDELPEEGDFLLTSAKADPGKVFTFGKHDATVSYTFDGTTSNVRIQVVKRSSGRIVKGWVQQDREPYTRNTATWNGKTERGVEAPNGKYKFKVGPNAAGAKATDGSRFGHYDHVFPVQGPHSYGEGFGAPRDGHTHQGQDVFASCGTKLVAARGGTVQWKAYHSAAGYYLVIDAKKDDHDHMYAHLKNPAVVNQGDRVRSGEKIGEVGKSGNATGCHLHFEYWKGDWWGGGSPLPKVTRVLKKWDSWS